MPSYRIELRGRSLNLVYTHHKGTRIPMQIKCDPDKFQEKEGHWVKGDQLTNLAIEAKLSEVKEYVKKYLLTNNTYPPHDDMAGFFKEKPKAFSEMNFGELWNQFIRFKTTQGDDSVGDSRLAHYQVTLNMLLKFRPKLKITDIDMDFYRSLKEYFQKVKNYSKNTQTTHITILKTFMKWAKSKKVVDYEDGMLKEMKGKFYPRDIIYHPISELRLMLNLNLDFWPEMAEVRDRYLLQNFTGLRKSDLFSKSWQIGEDFIKKIAIKTEGSSEEVIVVPLRSEAKVLIRRMLTREGGYRSIPDSDYNEQIKDVGRLAGLKYPVYMVHGKRQFKAGQSYPKFELLSSHVARSSFICQMIEAGVHYKMIMVMTGIKDVKTLDHYAAVMDVTLKETMAMVVRHQKLSGV